MTTRKGSQHQASSSSRPYNLVFPGWISPRLYPIFQSLLAPSVFPLQTVLPLHRELLKDVVRKIWLLHGERWAATGVTLADGTPLPFRVCYIFRVHGKWCFLPVLSPLLFLSGLLSTPFLSVLLLVYASCGEVSRRNGCSGVDNEADCTGNGYGATAVPKDGQKTGF